MNDGQFPQTDLTPYLEAFHHAVFLLASVTAVPDTLLLLPDTHEIDQEDWWEFNGDAHRVTFGS